MGNFWSAFREAEVAGDFTRIHDDGFNTVILLVPWAQFQPDRARESCDPRLLQRLGMLFDTAQATGLDVILRVGYLWDTFPSTHRTYQRLYHLAADASYRSMWRAYHRQVAAVAEARSNFRFAFISWEDLYWPTIRPIAEHFATYDAVQRAASTGFRDFLARRYSLAGLANTYGVHLEDWSRLAMPRDDEALFGECLEFFDKVLVERAFRPARECWRDLRYECRIDRNMIPGKGTSVHGYGIDNRVPDSGPAVIYYHLNAGTAYSSRELTAETALGQLETFLRAQQLAHGPGVFVDQFNFMVDNPRYPNFMTMPWPEALEFVDACCPILARYTGGYGIWGYRDWTNDKIYNGNFEFGLEGWQVKGDHELQTSPEGSALVLFEGSLLVQWMMAGRNLVNPVLAIDCEALTDTTLRISRNNSARPPQEIKVLEGRRRHEFALPSDSFQRLRIRVVTGDIRIHSVRYYSSVMSNGLHTLGGRPTPVMEAITRLNAMLPSNGPAIGV